MKYVPFHGGVNFQQGLVYLVQPIMIGYIVNFFLGKPGFDQTTAIALSCTIVALSLVFSFTNSVLFFHAALTGMKMRAAFTGVIYEKVSYA